MLSKLKKKNMLWWAGLATLVLSLAGIVYGVWVCYNGILIKSSESEPLLNLLEENSMTTQDGVYALISFGTVFIIYYLFVAGLGALGVLSSGKLLVRHTLFWYDVFLIAFSVILGLSGLLDWLYVGVNLAVLGFYIVAVFRKYTLDFDKIQKRDRD